MGTLPRHGKGPYHIETSPLICSANHRTGFYVIGTPIMKELIFIPQLLRYFRLK